MTPVLVDRADIGDCMSCSLVWSVHVGALVLFGVLKWEFVEGLHEDPLSSILDKHLD